jgi:hypothetical protein
VRHECYEVQFEAALADSLTRRDTREGVEGVEGAEPMDSDPQ